MQYFKASVIAALVASVSALQVTSPAQGSSLDLTKTNTITWTSVDSDPSSFEIVLVDMTVNPSVSKVISQSVSTSDHSYTLSPMTGVTPGSGYQINFLSTSTQNTGILAQSPQFTVVSSGSSTTSASFSSSTPGTSSASSTGSSTLTTTTSSSSTTGSSSSSSSSSSSGSSASSTATSTSSSTSSASSSAAVATSSGNAASSVHITTGFAGLSFIGLVAAMFA